MASKVRKAHKRIGAGGFVLPSPKQIVAAKTPAGAWTARQLAEWGIEWPPPEGWRAYLNTLWRRYGGKYSHHDTVFDRAFQQRWLRISSEDEIPVVNPRRGL
jgi:hypothetical protein